MVDEFDAVVVGGGIAGLSAALMLGRSRRRTLVIDSGAPRNRFAAHMQGVLGHDGLGPAALLDLGRAEADRYGVAQLHGTVAALADEGDRIRVSLADGRDVLARVVVLATGVRDDLPDVPGLGEGWGRTVLHCPYCHGWEVAGRRLGVLATSAMSLHQARLVRQLSDDVSLFAAAVLPLDEDAAVELAARDVTIVPQPVQAVREESDGLVVITSDGAEHRVDALFTGGAPVLDLDFTAGLGLVRTAAPGEPLDADPMGATSHPRVFAAGNAVAPFGNVPVSMASGSTAGAGANAALVAEDFARAAAERSRARDAGWEQRYAERERFWSGGVNATVAALVAPLDPGAALDVGSGEGGDVVWLAEHGWSATGVDVSPTAVRRASDLARSRGVDVELHVGDGAASVDGEFDLVLATFLHSWEQDFPRLRLLRDAASRVRRGGHLLVVSHVSPPVGHHPGDDHAPLLRPPDEELALLALDPLEWRPVLVEIRPRPVVTGGAQHDADGVLLLRRASDARSRA